MPPGSICRDRRNIEGSRQCGNYAFAWRVNAMVNNLEVSRIIMTNRSPHSQSPFSVANVRLFIAFRILFNARFYYPVLAILFLDFGLTAQQYALLNVAWAASIVLLEVPSGALADTLGRRNLLRACSWFMVLEMGILTFAPRGDPDHLFVLFLLNRILSGAAEAMASGADEALAYDSLQQAGLQEKWSRVLEVLMRWQSVAFVIALSMGGILYDNHLLQGMADGLGLQVSIEKGFTMRIPLFLVFVQSLVLVVVTWRMCEVLGGGERAEKAARLNCSRLELARHSTIQAFATTLKAGRWILATPFAFVIILFGLFFDSIIRVFLTFNSQYFRIIELPEASFGVIGAAFAALGIALSSVARNLAENRTPLFNAGLLILLTIAGLSGLAFHTPYWGLIPVIPLMIVMTLLGFFVSYYLNRVTASAERATVLSFRGLAFNLAYGVVGMLFAGLLKALRHPLMEAHPGLAGPALEDRVFAASLNYWLPWFLATLVAVTLISLWKFKQSRNTKGR